MDEHPGNNQGQQLRGRRGVRGKTEEEAKDIDAYQMK